MGKFNSDDHYIYYCGQESLRKNGVAIISTKESKMHLGAVSKTKDDLGLLPRQTIQHHNNPSLCPNHWCWRRWSWTVLWRPIRPSRTNTHQRCSFHHRGLAIKSRKSRNTWSNRQIWPWSTEQSRAKANRVLRENTPVIANTLFQQHKRRLYTWTSPDGQYWNQIVYILCSHSGMT